MKKIATLLLFVLFVQTLYATAPTVTGSNLKFSSLDGNRFSSSFTTGNGATRIVVVKEGGPVTGLPVNGKEYTANGNFGTAGTEFTAPGEYVVSRTGWGTFDVQNLKPATTYYVAIFEYNGTGINADYLMLPLTGNQATVQTPAVQATALTTSSVTGNAVTLNWTKGDGTGRLVIARKGAAVNAMPVDLTNYYNGEGLFGSGTQVGTGNFVVYKGTGASAVIKNLEPNTVYHFAVVEYNGISFPMHLTPGAVASVTTNTGPTIAPTSVGFTYVEGNRFTVSCTQGNGTRRLFIMRKGAAVTAVPVNGINYTANSIFGTPGSEIAPDEFVVAATTGNGINVTNLEAGTTYYFRVYEYDADNNNYPYYLTGSYASKSGSTAIVPTTVPSNLKLVTLTGSSATISFTPGNGSYRLAVAKEGSAVDAVPANFTVYSGNSNFGSGTQITSGNYSIVSGMNGTQFTINSLKPGINYHVAIFEFNGSSYPVYSQTAATFNLTIPLEPTSISTSPWSTFYEGSSFRLIWNNGNGARRIVVAKKGSAVTATPVDGSSYTASSNFGEGSALLPGEFVVYDGIANNVDVKKLDISGTYHFAVFEYNVAGDGSPDYLTSSWLAASVSTVTWPTTQSTIQSVTSIQSAQATINLVKGNGDNRLFIMREGAAVNVEPQDLTKYSYNSAFGNSGAHMGNGNYVVWNSSSIGSFTVSNLKPKTTYYVTAFEYNGYNEPAYLRTAPPTYSFTTADVPGATVPTTAAVNPAFTNTDGNKFTFGWTNGNGEKRIVVMKKGSAVSFVPSSATSYTANAAFGSGTDLGGGEYVVYNGAGSSVDITNLLPATNYYFSVYEYNGTSDLIRYLTTSTLTTSGSTATPPVTAVSNVASSTSSNSLTLNWSNGSGSGRIVVMKEGSAVTGSPVNLSVYPANTVFKSGSQLAAGEYVVYAGSASTVTVTGLSSGNYYYSIFEYNGASGPVYNTSNVASGAALISSTLPVQLLYFSAKENKGNAVLNWATDQEMNNAFFFVERSADGVNYQTVKSIRGAGNSNERLEYSYTDSLNGSQAKLYYRLRQVDVDGKTTYSAIVMVQFNSVAANIRTYPNPVVDQFRIELPNNVTNAALSIYDAAGTQVAVQKISNGQFVNCAGLARGVYYVHVQVGDKRYQSRIVKQ